VAITYSTMAIQTRIVGSRELRHSETSIHKVVVHWMNELQGRLRVAIGYAAVPM
jgi:hypothetical protein